jgi:hypothetical protein
LISAKLTAITGSVTHEPIRDFTISDHARVQMVRRGIDRELVVAVLTSPEQRELVRPGRLVLHSRVRMGTPPRMYLLRVVVDVDRHPAEVVTVYRATKVSRYWRDAP